MMKRALFLLLIFLSPILFVTNVNAAKYSTVTPTPTPTVSPTPSPLPPTFNSFEAFWPLTSGRTMDSKLYFIKTLKENLRGMLIFGAAPKVDYNVFLATKRALEAEQLLNMGKLSLVNKTLDQALSKLDEAQKSLDSVKANGGNLGELSGGVVSRLTNLEKLSMILSSKNDETKAKFLSLNEKVKVLLPKI